MDEGHIKRDCGEILLRTASKGVSFTVDLPNLIEAAQSGDVGAISELYDRYASMILRYLFVRVYETELAQDLTQEVFIKVIKGIDQFEYRGEKSLLGWLYTIASNVLSSHQRRRKLPSTPLDQQAELVDARSQNDVRHVFDRIALQQAIAQLTDDQQQVLTLRFFADLSNSEIAELLNRTEGSVKALQHRALQSLYQIMVREDDDETDQQEPQRTKQSRHRSASSARKLHQRELGESQSVYETSPDQVEKGD